MSDAAAMAKRDTRGKLLASVLAGSWRSYPPSCSSLADELAEISPRLLQTWTASLAWWQVRQSPLSSEPSAVKLQQAYRFHSVECLLRESQIRETVSALRLAGVEPLLVKGWAVARLYPELALRPFTDIDLCVQPEHFSAAQAALVDLPPSSCPVDLHSGVPDLEDRPLKELYDRSVLVTIDRVEVRILSPEDNLRMLCHHLLRHGAWRPIWLCDVGAALEALPENFDWDYCLRGEKRRADWVACTIGLAHQLLGARLHESPVSWRARHLPRWLAPAVLGEWGGEGLGDSTRGEPLLAYWRSPAELVRALARRWPNPIHATIWMRGPFNNLPRFPFQLIRCASRAVPFLVRLAKSFRRSGFRS